MLTFPFGCCCSSLCIFAPIRGSNNFPPDLLLDIRLTGIGMGMGTGMGTKQGTGTISVAGGKKGGGGGIKLDGAAEDRTCGCGGGG